MPAVIPHYFNFFPNLCPCTVHSCLCLSLLSFALEPLNSSLCVSTFHLGFCLKPILFFKEKEIRKTNYERQKPVIKKEKYNDRSR